MVWWEGFIEARSPSISTARADVEKNQAFSLSSTTIEDIVKSNIKRIFCRLDNLRISNRNCDVAYVPEDLVFTALRYTE
jgi:hypothetical protein